MPFLVNIPSPCELGLVIAVSGLPGSGKSTLAKRLSQIYGLRYVSSGLLFRQMAKERGLTLEEFTRQAESDFSIDRAIDERALAEAMRGCVVLDGHIAGWVAKEYAHVKIYLNAPREVRAKRVAMRDKKSLEEALKEVTLRDESESKRFREIYGIDVSNLSIFDLVINTSLFDIETTLKISTDGIDYVISNLLEAGKA